MSRLTEPYRNIYMSTLDEVKEKMKVTTPFLCPPLPQLLLKSSPSLLLLEKHSACSSKNHSLCRSTRKYYVVIRASTMFFNAQALCFPTRKHYVFSCHQLCGSMKKVLTGKGTRFILSRSSIHSVISIS